MPLVVVVLAVIVLLLLITWLKWNPFICLILTAIGVGLAMGMPMDKIIQSIQDGLGGTLGFLAIVLALGTMLGKMMAESGGGERIADTLLKRFGKKNVHWAMMIVAFIVGIPVFFQVGFVLLVPLVFTIALETGVSLVQIGIPLVAGLSTVHGLVPPHPAAMLAVQAYKADVGKTIIYSVIIGLPTAIISGPIFGKWIGKRIVKQVPDEMKRMMEAKEAAHKKSPSFGTTMFTILLPVILMLLATIADVSLAKDSTLRHFLDFIGNAIVALLIATIVSFFTMGFAQGLNRETILKFTNECLAPIASIMLVIGAGGAFNKVLLNSGIGTYIAEIGKTANISPILLGWSIAALIRVATGSATVSMTTAAGIVAPMAFSIPGVNRELLVLATGAGSLILSHVNDSGFWMIKEYFGMTVKETLQTWTAMETILSIVALILCLIVNAIV